MKSTHPIKKIPFLFLLALTGQASAVVTQIIMYDFDPRMGGFANMGGTDYVSTTINTTGPVVGAGTGAERIEWSGNTTTLSLPTAPGLTSVNMTAASGSGTVRIGNNTGGGLGMPGAGVGIELGFSETMTFTFDQPIALTEIDANWWDGADQLQMTVNGSTYQNPAGVNRNNPVNLASVGFPTTTFTDPLSGNSVTGVAIAAGTAITFSVYDANGNGSLDGDGLIQGLKFAVVPEPSRVFLIVVGLGSLFLRRRR